MSFTITAGGNGQSEDDLRATFNELVQGLRSVTPEGGTFSAAMSTGSVTYSDADVPDEDPEDSDPDPEDPRP